MTKLCDRIDAALEKAALRGMQVRAIYLTAEDQDQFDAEMSKIERCNGSFLSYREHQIRRGQTTRIYSTHGCEIAIPVRLSAKVA